MYRSTIEFVAKEDIQALKDLESWPIYVYDESSIRERAKQLMSTPHAYGFIGRFAMKACSVKSIMDIFKQEGVHLDASSGYEVDRALLYNFKPEHIQITSQVIPENLPEFLEQGVLYNACSLHQLNVFGQIKPGAEISIRVNPGKGSGHNAKAITGGPLSSFGIWHEQLPDVFEIVDKYNLKLTGLHSHIGAGTDPEVWNECAELTLDIARKIQTINRVNLGGGFKVARTTEEQSADINKTALLVKGIFEKFAKETGRELQLEYEPGTFLMANSGAIVSEVIDLVSTGTDGRDFVKLNMGMTENMRVSLYDAIHPIVFMTKKELGEPQKIQVVGRCCETGDVVTPDVHTLPKPNIGDTAIVYGCGAYCDGMSAVGYNSYPQAGAALKASNGDIKLIRRRQTLEQLIQNEI